MEFLLASWDIPLSLILPSVAALHVGAFLLWQAILVPRPNYGTGNLTLLLLLFLGLANGWWLQQPHWFAPDGRYLFLSVLPPIALAVAALLGRRRWTATQAVVWHGLIFAWIGYGAFPYFGELP